ncbi:hypothetical protein BOVA604_1018 [Bacteroides ovatus]|jgi:putative membrane protein|uniref:DMT family transporter n=1 Tax=Bacteroides TaxID=816 RepID=UPI000E9F0FF5|nr:MULTISPECIES: DMT family transporter [Bacteroides]MCS3178226.1 DMT family transporter [Candidatus Bacteroides intestinigallinarum]RGN56571.1 EamA family transporter [Bacteroides sp. OM05-10AA]RGQ61798.1 EamA family transporter [Bacteroides sp. AF27-33]CAG9891110.1 hypothetical protein BOVA604_1018 [Bacteroides ovatus]
MRKLILVLPVLAGVLWGSAGVFVRELNDFGMDGYTVLSTRMIVATVFLLIIIGLYNRSLLKINLKDLWLFAGTGLLGIMGLNYFYNEAVSEITLSLAAILLSMAPVFVMILSAFIFRERITVKKINCLILAIVGCTLASGVLEAASGMGLQVSVRGIVMGLLSGFFCALYGIFSKIAANRGYSTYTILFYSLLLCTVALLPVTNWGVFISFIEAAPLKNTLFAVAHSTCTSILPYLFYSIALLYMENGKVSILAGGGEPIAAVVFGVLFFSEIPTILILIGLVITIIALSFLCMPLDRATIYIRYYRIQLCKIRYKTDF